MDDNSTVDSLRRKLSSSGCLPKMRRDTGFVVVETK